jgi:HTH-type transcriptional regulator/antitoxin HigA
MVKVIRSPEEHAAALRRLEQLLDENPPSGSPASDELDVLGVLVAEYERTAFPVRLPDPIDAIKFRMEQAGLSQRELVPFLGSRSKVSEVLSGKRQLTLSMIRALHDGLGIPSEVLLQDRSPALLEESDFDWKRFPVAEMRRLGWFSSKKPVLRDAESAIRDLFGLDSLAMTPAVLFRRTRNERSTRTMDSYAVMAWIARIITRAREQRVETAFSRGTVTIDVMHRVARLSWADQGPRLAVEYLAKLGITVVVERHLARTHIDGAALLIDRNRPVIGLSARYDRLDNFWHCLMHELAHLSLHLRDESTTFVDDLDTGSEGNVQESEADAMAREALIPAHEWEKSAASRLRSADAAVQLANALSIHPAIVAGRIRYERKNFRLLGNLVGAGEVRKLFPDVYWG